MWGIVHKPALMLFVHKVKPPGTSANSLSERCQASVLASSLSGTGHVLDGALEPLIDQFRAFKVSEQQSGKPRVVF